MPAFCMSSGSAGRQGSLRDGLKPIGVGRPFGRFAAFAWRGAACEGLGFVGGCPGAVPEPFAVVGGPADAAADEACAAWAGGAAGPLCGVSAAGRGCCFGRSLCGLPLSVWIREISMSSLLSTLLLPEVFVG